MEKTRLIKSVTILTIITTVITLVSAAFDFLMSRYLSHKFHMDASNASSIGIIGGADGPTAIFVTGKASLHLITIIFGLFSIAGIVYRIFTRKTLK
ncbi:MAG: sodium ion-translocating decarboxylase subunit beta [Clostridia bacterium]